MDVLKMLDALTEFGKVFGPWAVLGLLVFFLAKEGIKRGFTVHIEVGRKR